MAAIVAWAFVARWHGLIGPFGTGWQWLGAAYAIQARNLLRNGLVATHFTGFVNADQVPPSEWTYYMHHPPGTVWSMAASLGVLGDTAFATKLPFVLASLGEVVVIYFLVSRALSIRAGLVAALMTATLPAGAYYSTHGSELGPVPVCLSLVALLLDERARDRDPDRPKSAAPLAAFVAATLFSWVAFSVAGWIALRDLWSRRWRRALVFGLAPPVVLGLHLLHVRLATGSWSGGVRGSLFDEVVVHGVSGFANVVAQSGVESAVGRLFGHLRELFTSTGLAIIVLGSLLIAFRRRFPALRSTRVPTLFLALLVFALGYSLPFPEAVWFHSYWLLIALPFASLCAAVVMHVATARKRLGAIAATGFLALALSSTLEVRAAQLRDATPYFEELGDTLRDMTSPGTKILSEELTSPCLLFYAERGVFELRSDRELDVLRSKMERSKSNLPVRFAWISPSQDPSLPRGRLEAWLRDRYAATEVDLPRSGRHLTLFDMSRPK